MSWRVAIFFINERSYFHNPRSIKKVDCQKWVVLVCDEYWEIMSESQHVSIVNIPSWYDNTTQPCDITINTSHYTTDTHSILDWLSCIAMYWSKLDILMDQDDEYQAEGRRLSTRILRFLLRVFGTVDWSSVLNYLWWVHSWGMMNGFWRN